MLAADGGVDAGVVLVVEPPEYLAGHYADGGVKWTLTPAVATDETASVRVARELAGCRAEVPVLRETPALPPGWVVLAVLGAAAGGVAVGVVAGYAAGKSAPRE